MSRSHESGRRTLLLHGAITFGATSLVNVLNYLFHVLGSRWLGPAGYGEAAALINLLALASIPASVVQLVVAKLVAELPASGEGASIPRVFDRLLRLALWSALGVLVAGWILTAPLASFLRVSETLPVALTVAVVAINLVLTSLRGILQGAQRFGPFAASLALEAAGKSLIGLALIAHHLGVAGALLGWALGSLASLALTIDALRRAFPQPGQPLHLDMSRLWQSSQGIAATQACVTALAFSDIVVVKHFFDPVEAGIYSAVALCGKILLFLVGFVPLLVLPRAAAQTATRQNSRNFLLAAGAFLFVVSGAVLSLFAVAPQAVIGATSGSAFLAAAPFIVPYGIAMTLLAATQIVTTYNVGQHRFRFVVPLSLVTIAEISALVFVPHHIVTIVRTLVVGNACCLIASLVPLGGTQSAPLAAVPQAAGHSSSG